MHIPSVVSQTLLQQSPTAVQASPIARQPPHRLSPSTEAEQTPEQHSAPVRSVHVAPSSRPQEVVVVVVVVVVVTAPAVVVSATVAPPVVAAAPKLVVCPSDCEVEVWLHVSVTWPHWYSHVNSQLDTVHVASHEFTEY